MQLRMMPEVLDDIEMALEKLYDYVQDKIDRVTLHPQDRALDILVLEFSKFNLEFAELSLALTNDNDCREELARYENIANKFDGLNRDVQAYLGD